MGEGTTETWLNCEDILMPAASFMAALTSILVNEEKAMAQERLLQLAQQLQQLGTDTLFYKRKPLGLALQSFIEKQREVLITADKLERELADEVRFNPSRLMGIEYPLDDEIDSITRLVAGLEDIKQSAVDSVDELPSKTEIFSQLLAGHISLRGVLN
jgi:hypothetical protein